MCHPIHIYVTVRKVASVMIGVIVLQMSGATLAIGGVVVTAAVLWTVLWLTNRYEKKLAEGR